jgi:hypothetical protein
MTRNPRGMDADRELQGCIYAFSNHKAVLALQRAMHAKISIINASTFCKKMAVLAGVFHEHFSQGDGV